MPTNRFRPQDKFTDLQFYIFLIQKSYNIYLHIYLKYMFTGSQYRFIDLWFQNIDLRVYRFTYLNTVAD